MKKILEEIRKFNKERDLERFHSETNLAKSICIEAGELLECFQWLDIYDKEDVKNELADVIIYCIMLADKLNADTEEIILNKIEKNKLKYPIDKIKGKSTKNSK